MKLSYLYQLINLISGIVLLLMVLAKLESGIYLQWVLFQTLTGALIQIEQSLNTVATRAISRARERGTRAALASAIRQARNAYLVFSLVAGTALLLLGAVYLREVSDGRFSPYWFFEWAIYVGSFMIYYIATHHACALVALGRPDRFAQIALVIRVGNLALSVTLLVAGFGVVGLCTSAMISFVIGSLWFRTAGREAVDLAAGRSSAAIDTRHVQAHFNLKQVALQLLFVLSAYGLYRVGLASIAATELNTGAQAGFALAIQIFTLLVSIASVPLTMRVAPLIACVESGDQARLKNELGFLAAYVNLVFVSAAASIVAAAPLIRTVLPDRGAALPPAEHLLALAAAFWLEVNLFVLANALVAARRFDFAYRYAGSAALAAILAWAAWRLSASPILSFVLVPAAVQAIVAAPLLSHMLHGQFGLGLSSHVRSTFRQALRIVRHPISVGLRFSI